MLSIILIIGVIAAGLMIAIVLVQNPKGGGLASNFSSSNQIFGVQRTTEGVEKLTWIFALVILLVSLAASSYNGQTKSGGESGSSDPKLEELMNAKPEKQSTPPTVPQQNQSPEPTNANP